MKNLTAKETAKEYLIELFDDDYANIICQDENKLTGMIKQYAKDACKEQREICYKVFQDYFPMMDDYIKESMINAKTPELK